MTDSRISENHLRPNLELTDQERSEKRTLKRLLKRQTRRRKLETRLHQAILRKDSRTEERSRKELEKFLEEEKIELMKTHPIFPNISDPEFRNSNDAAAQDSDSSPKATSLRNESKARHDIEVLYQKLYNVLKQERKIVNSDENSSVIMGCEASLKEQQTAEARVLLLNMTKGTQTTQMFTNHNALMGYTRQKFHERACVAISSLAKLDPRRRDDNLYGEIGRPPSLQDAVWNRLSSIQSICSIGCGPGCDATGLVQFLKTYATPFRRDSLQAAVVDKIIFLDWTMERWKPLLAPLVDKILIPEKYVVSVNLSFCDVLQPLSDSSNHVAKNLLATHNMKSGCGSWSVGAYCSNCPEDAPTSHIDLFVTSYLLTETRGKWHNFYRDIVSLAKPGALFLFQEPKAWQLHTFIQQHKQEMEFIWLDSTMHSPALQALEGRIGPAVLVAMKQ